MKIVLFYFLILIAPVYSDTLEEKLLKDLGSSDSEVQISAAEKLGRIYKKEEPGELSPNLVETLKSFVTQGTPMQQKGAAYALGEIAEPSTAEFLRTKARREAMKGNIDIAMILEHSFREIPAECRTPFKAIGESSLQN